MEIRAESTALATIPVPASKIDLTDWLFSLDDAAYQACSADHIAAGASRSPEGKRISVNVEQIAGNLLVQHYQEDISGKDHCRVHSLSDSFGPLGRTKLDITWELRLEEAGSGACALSNHVIVKATPAFVALLQEHNITDPEPLKRQMQQNLETHNREETPLFAADITRKARAGQWD